MKYLKKHSATLPNIEINDEIKEISIDQMWHFIDKKKKNLGVASSVQKLVQFIYI